MAAIESHQLTNAARVFGAAQLKHQYQSTFRCSELELAARCSCGEVTDPVNTEVNSEPDERCWEKWKLHADREGLKAALLSLQIGVRDG